MTPTEFESSTLDLLMWVLRLALILAFAALIYFIFMSFANAIECRTEPEKHGAWSWRYVQPFEHRKCWYKGTRVLPKSELHWPADRVPIIHRAGSMRPNPPGLGTANPLKLARPSLDPTGNIVHLSGAPLETFNEIDATADVPPLENIIEDRPFAPWEERVGGAFK